MEITVHFISIIALFVYKKVYKSPNAFSKSTLINATCSLRFVSGEKRQKQMIWSFQKSYEMKMLLYFCSFLFYAR